MIVVSGKTKMDKNGNRALVADAAFVRRKFQPVTGRDHLEVAVPVAIGMHIVMAGNVMKVIVVGHEFAGVVIQVRGIMPMAMADAITVHMPPVARPSVMSAVVSMAMMPMTDVDMDAAATKMKRLSSRLLCA
jgi:hypothetical protein